MGAGDGTAYSQTSLAKVNPSRDINFATSIGAGDGTTGSEFDKEKIDAAKVFLGDEMISAGDRTASNFRGSKKPTMRGIHGLTSISSTLSAPAIALHARNWIGI